VRASAPTSMPSIAELRAATQPPSLFARNSGEHWAGRLYVRRLSPYLTRAAIPTRVTPNAMTYAMIVVGVLAAVALSLPGVLTAVAAVVLIQLQILLDCSDGELARWRKQFSPAGIYLDRIAHYVTETLFPIALGIRADGGWDEAGGTYTLLGLIAAVLALFVRTESALVAVARLESGRTKAEDTVEVAAPRVSALARLRRAVGFFPFFRVFIAVECTLVALVFTLLDAVDVLVIAMVPIAAITAVGHLVAILASDRLR
jgi:phosphatidylglycerophosphate synthase